MTCLLFVISLPSSLLVRISGGLSYMQAELAQMADTCLCFLPVDHGLAATCSKARLCICRRRDSDRRRSSRSPSRERRRRRSDSRSPAPRKDRSEPRKERRSRRESD